MKIILFDWLELSYKVKRVDEKINLMVYKLWTTPITITGIAQDLDFHSYQDMHQELFETFGP